MIVGVGPVEHEILSETALEEGREQLRIAGKGQSNLLNQMVVVYEVI